MHDLFTPAVAEALERSMLLGLSRSPLPGVTYPGDDAPLPPLACLALLAQRGRFHRPLGAADGISHRRLLPDDDRRMLTGSLRDACVRLLTSHGREASELIAQAVFRLLRCHGLRPHPFDLPELETALALAREELGPTESAFLALKSGQTAQPGRVIDDSNWADFPKPERLAFIRALRRANPDRARELIEARLPLEPPAMRAELIQVLEEQLGPADCDLLESAGGDRAPSVRKAAQELLQQIPGTPAYAERLEQLASRFQLKQSGMLRRRAVLSFTLPPRPPGSEWPVSHGALFAGTRLSDLARTLKLDVATFIDALPASDRELALALLSAAVADGLFDLIPALSARAIDIGLYGVLIGVAYNLSKCTPGDRETVLRALFNACIPKDFLSSMSWKTVAEILPNSLPPDMAQAVLGWKSWREFLTDVAKTQTFGDRRKDLLAFALVVPHPQAAMLVRDLEPLPPEATVEALAYARFVSAVAAFADAPPHQIKEKNP